MNASLPFVQTSAVLVLCVSVAYACGSETPTSPSVTVTPSVAAPAPAPSPPAGALTRYRVSGRVTDEAGSPIPGVLVEIDYSPGGEPSTPPSNCPSFATFCWLVTRTDASGHYEAEIVPGARKFGGTFGYVYTIDEGFASHIQLLPNGPVAITRDLRLRRRRTIGSSDSITISVEPDSTACTDLEGFWMWDFRCEIVEVRPDSTGTLAVTARAESGVIPQVIFATSGNYTTSSTGGSGTATVGVTAGQRYWVFVGVPNTLPAQRIEVSTRLE